MGSFSLCTHRRSKYPFDPSRWSNIQPPPPYPQPNWIRTCAKRKTKRLSRICRSNPRMHEFRDRSMDSARFLLVGRGLPSLFQIYRIRLARCVSLAKLHEKSSSCGDTRYSYIPKIPHSYSQSSITSYQGLRICMDENCSFAPTCSWLFFGSWDIAR